MHQPATPRRPPIDPIHPRPGLSRRRPDGSRIRIKYATQASIRTKSGQRLSRSGSNGSVGRVLAANAAGAVGDRHTGRAVGASALAPAFAPDLARLELRAVGSGDAKVRDALLGRRARLAAAVACARFCGGQCRARLRPPSALPRHAPAPSVGRPPRVFERFARGDDPALGTANLAAASALKTVAIGMAIVGKTVALQACEERMSCGNDRSAILGGRWARGTIVGPDRTLGRIGGRVDLGRRPVWRRIGPLVASEAQPSEHDNEHDA